MLRVLQTRPRGGARRLRFGWPKIPETRNYVISSNLPMRVRMKVLGVLASVMVILGDSSRHDAGVFSLRRCTPAKGAPCFGRPSSALIGKAEPTPGLTHAGQPQVKWSTKSTELKLSPGNSSPNDVNFTTEYGQFRNPSSWECTHASHERPCSEEFSQFVFAST
jgi:hypothetical protein